MSRFTDGWVPAYFEHGIDIVNRRVFIRDIEEETIDAAIKGLYLMETEDKEKPCELFISSFGGSVYEALALYDIINTLRCPVHTFAYGKCMSAAPLLLAAGEPGHRWVAPNVSFMHHQWSDELCGKGDAIKADLKHNEKLEATWLSLITKHSSKTLNFWKTRAKLAADFYFGSDEAIEWGIADQMWVEK